MNKWTILAGITVMALLWTTAEITTSGWLRFGDEPEIVRQGSVLLLWVVGIAIVLTSMNKSMQVDSERRKAEREERNRIIEQVRAKQRGE